MSTPEPGRRKLSPPLSLQLPVLTVFDQSHFCYHRAEEKKKGVNLELRGNN